MHHYLLTAGRLAVAAVCLTLLSARPALSQVGATRADVGGTDKLNFTFDLAESIDSALPVEAGGAPVAASGLGTVSTMFSASTAYFRSGRQLQLGGNASTAFKYYQRLDRTEALSSNAGLGMQIRLPKRGTLAINQSAAYSPSYLYQLFPEVDPPSLGASIPSNPEYEVAQTESYSYNTGIAVRFGSARSTQFVANGDYAKTNFEGQAQAPPGVRTSSAGATVSRALSRSSAVDLGYQYRTGEFESEGRSKEHRLGLGAVYAPALSASRRLTIRLNVSPSWIDVAEVGLTVPESELTVPESALTPSTAADADEYQFAVLGSVNVSYPFRRNWRVGASYERTVQYLAGLSEPLFSDGVRADFNGLLTRGLDLSASVGYVTATSALPGSNANLDSYTGTVKLRYALTRSFALYSDYLYYSYDQQEQDSLSTYLPSMYEQHSVRFGFTLSIETLGR